MLYKLSGFQDRELQQEAKGFLTSIIPLGQTYFEMPVPVQSWSWFTPGYTHDMPFKMVISPDSETMDLPYLGSK